MSLDSSPLSPPAAQCVCSSIGFENPLWNDHYYPENCPEEWRFAYFMNDFRAVYLSCADWLNSDARIAALADELDDRFELILEWPLLNDEQNTETVLSQLTPLAQNVACIIVNVDGVSLRELEAAHAAIARCFTVNFYTNTLDAHARKELAQRFRVSFVWDPGQSLTPIATVDYQVVRLPCQSLRAVRTVLLKLQPIFERDTRVGLFFEPAEQSVNRALEVRTLIELMGMA